MAKILVVDDDEEFALLIQESLSLENHAVELCHHGGEASDLLSRYSYDLVILDWQLPGETGIEVLRKFRNRKTQTPVLMLTGMTSVPDKTFGLDSGADDYLAKPTHPQELAARVRALLRRAAGHVSNTITYRDIEVDLEKHMVTKSGKKVDLLPREYALLQFFVRNTNRVFSNDEIMNSVWPSDSEASPETVKSCVKRVRQKLDTDGTPSIIRNIYGVGYVMDA